MSDSVKVNPFGNGSHGEVVCWESPEGGNVRYTAIVESLKRNGLDHEFARELCPHYAFLRGVKKLSENRIIRELRNDKTSITFQFTGERLEGDSFQYSLEAILTLDKDTGKVSCPVTELEQRAQELLNEASSRRTASDITRLVQKLFKGQADLFAIRRQGGAYFVPYHQIHFVERIHAFLLDIGGDLVRLPIKTGTEQGDKSVKRAVQEGIASAIDEHTKAIEKLSDSSRQSTIDQQFEEIEITQLKIEAYSLYLDSAKSTLDEALANAKRLLREKVIAINSDDVADVAAA